MWTRLLAKKAGRGNSDQVSFVGLGIEALDLGFETGPLVLKLVGAVLIALGDQQSTLLQALGVREKVVKGTRAVKQTGTYEVEAGAKCY